VGLDGCQEFVELAQKRTGCEVLHQDFLKLNLKPFAFDGVFANASLFHVPTQELERVLLALNTCLRFNGVFFCSNPRGPDIEQFDGDRYGAFLEPETWGNFVRSAGFIELESFYRPSGRPKEQQPWLATVWRKPGRSKDRVEAVAEPGLV
jgi:SAM-dependent methyltransferase